LLVAIPAPASAPTLSGAYWTASLEFPGSSAANARNSFFSLATASGGQFSSFTASGHAANLAGGLPVTQTVSNSSYTLNADGSGSLSFGSSDLGVLFSGNRTFY